MSKRARPSTLTILILRGIPGTGKSTLAEKICSEFRNNLDNPKQAKSNIRCISRDTVREEFLRSLECKEILNGKEINYQESFKNATINTLVRDRYFDEIETAYRIMRYNDGDNLILIDSTNTKIADLVRLLKILQPYDSIIKYMEMKTYILTKRHEHGNIHDVPEKVMNAFRQELRESDEWLKRKYPKKERVTLL